MTTRNDVDADKQYHFTILLKPDKIYFNMSPFLRSLEPTPYRVELEQLEKKVDAGEYRNEDGTPLTGKRLCTKLGLLMNSFKVFKGKLEMQQSFLTSRTVTTGHNSQDEGQPSIGRKTVRSQSRGARHKKPPITPSSSGCNAPKALFSSKKLVEKDSEQSSLDSLSYLEQMTTIPEALHTDRKLDYKVVSAMYKNFWETCSNAFISGVDEKKELLIDKLIDASA